MEGSLRQGKSFFVKRLISTLAGFGRYAINTSDSKGEHGALARELGGDVFRMGVFGSSITINPLEAGERRRMLSLDGESSFETEEQFRARIRTARLSVLQQILGLLNPGGRLVSSKEKGILSWVLDEVVKDTGDHPTIRALFEKLTSPQFRRDLSAEFTVDDSSDLRDGLRVLVSGDLAGMFDTHSTVSLNPGSPYTVIDTSAAGLRGELGLPVTQTVTNAWVNLTISNKNAGRRYCLIREEGWLDMRTLAALLAHQEQLKFSGEFGISLVLVAHEGGDFDAVGPEGSQERDLARSIVRGYANRICFNQPQSVLKLARASGTYTEAETAAIAGLGRGQFLAKLHNRSYVVDGNPTTTDWERRLFDTDRQMRGAAA